MWDRLLQKSRKNLNTELDYFYLIICLFITLI